MRRAKFRGQKQLIEGRLLERTDLRFACGRGTKPAPNRKIEGSEFNYLEMGFIEAVRNFSINRGSFSHLEFGAEDGFGVSDVANRQSLFGSSWRFFVLLAS